MLQTAERNRQVLLDRSARLRTTELITVVFYHDDPGVARECILAGATPLSDYFARLGLLLIVNEDDGFAYLRQIEPETLSTDYPPIPKLFRSIRLTFEASLLCVQLRQNTSTSSNSPRTLS